MFSINEQNDFILTFEHKGYTLEVNVPITYPHTTATIWQERGHDVRVFIGEYHGDIRECLEWLQGQAQRL
jgi:hypothetical protein